ncbi:helix-turn-helix domain-containing protein [Raoultella planticola]|uniref:helix-turn-helix domain-containing protein n=1 Tax=Raoultella planticola TaxID=575 RepID=UPI0009B883BB|nr:helix-turn-helix domain-containing protein [Raoultella planticola]
MMRLKNIHLYNYVIVFTNCCDLYLKTTEEEIFIPHKTIAILEKNISFDVRLVRKGNGTLYQSLDLDEDMLASLRNVVEPFVHISPEELTYKRSFKDKIFKIDSSLASVNIIETLANKDNSKISRTYKLAYLVSKCEDITRFALSLYSTVAITLKERVSNLILKDISKKWKLSDVAEELNMSEISIRKKLDMEESNFNQLLLDARMNKAIKYLIKNTYQINIISNLVGYSSISYFIKTFKEYYGLTPKQFEIGIRKKLTE